MLLEVLTYAQKTLLCNWSNLCKQIEIKITQNLSNKEPAVLERLIPSKAILFYSYTIGLVSPIFSIPHSAHTGHCAGRNCSDIWWRASSWWQYLPKQQEQPCRGLTISTSSSSTLKTQDLNPGSSFINNSEHCSLGELCTYLSSTSYIRENIPSKGSNSFYYCNEIDIIWPYNIIWVQHLMSEWVSQVVHLCKLSFSSPKYTHVHKGL